MNCDHRRTLAAPLQQRRNRHGHDGAHREAIAAGTETCAGLACSTRIAIRGNASNAMKVPAVLIA